MKPFELTGADGKLICGDRLEGTGRQILFITGFLSKRWGNKSKALAQWCQEKGWGFCCYDVRGFGDSEGTFTDYTLSDWIDDARAVVKSLGASATSAAAIPEFTHPPRQGRDPAFPELTHPPRQRRDAAFPELTLAIPGLLRNRLSEACAGWGSQLRQNVSFSAGHILRKIDLGPRQPADFLVAHPYLLKKSPKRVFIFHGPGVPFDMRLQRRHDMTGIGMADLQKSHSFAGVIVMKRHLLGQRDHPPPLDHDHALFPLLFHVFIHQQAIWRP